MAYRAALIGCGRIGSEFADDPRVGGVYSHAEAYVVCPDTTLVAVCDTDPGKVERCGDRWHVEPRYRNLEEMLAEQEPEIISVCTPDSSHADLIRTVITAPSVRAILAEKPLAVVLEDAQELVHLAEERGIVLAVNYSRRYADSHRLLQEFLQAGGIGTVTTVNGYYSKGLLHNGTHWFDLARYLVGEVIRVQGLDTRGNLDNDPMIDALLEFDCGARGYLRNCYGVGFTLFEMDLIGTRGRVRIISSGNEIEVYRVADSPYYSGYKSLAPDARHRMEGGLGDVSLRAVEDIVRCLRYRGQPRCSGADAVAALEIAFTACKSARLGCVVTLQNG